MIALTKLLCNKGPSLLYYLPIAGGRRDKFMPFPRPFVWNEMKTASSKVWTLIADSCSYHDNHYVSKYMHHNDSIVNIICKILLTYEDKKKIKLKLNHFDKCFLSINICLKKAHCVMVIFVESLLGYLSSSPQQGCSYFI